MLVLGCEKRSQLTIEVPSSFHGDVNLTVCSDSVEKNFLIRLPMSGEAVTGACLRSALAIHFTRDGRAISPKSLSVLQTGDGIITGIHAVLP